MRLAPALMTLFMAQFYQDVPPPRLILVDRELPEGDLLAEARRVPGMAGETTVRPDWAPVAERMGIGSPEELHVPDQASLFWERYWEDRALDFTAPSVHRAVHRLVLRGTDLREQDLVQIDTFALGELLPAMAGTPAREALARLASLASHVTGRAVEIPASADASFARRAGADWQEWWYVHRTDYVPLAGAARVAAASIQTRYGKWILRAVSGQLGISTRDGEPILDKLRARAPVTLGLIGLAMLVSYALAIPLGVYSAVRRGRPIDSGLAGLLFAMYSLPTFWAAELLVRAFAGSGAFGLMPGGGMESADVAALATTFGLARARDVAAHLVLPVAALAVGALAEAQALIAGAQAQAERLTAATAAEAAAAPARLYATIESLTPPMVDSHVPA